MNKIKRTLNHKPKKILWCQTLSVKYTKVDYTQNSLIGFSKATIAQHLVQHKSDFVQGWEFQCMIQNTQGLQISERRVT